MPSLNSISTLTAKAPTDYWRKPPALDVGNAPTYFKEVNSTEFRRARVTVSADWIRLYDQGGLFVEFPKVIKSSVPGEADKRCWLKTGIEFFNDRPNLSTVSAREWADWSLLPLSDKKVTLEIAREEKDAATGAGSSLWVYLVENSDGREVKTAVREVTWAFETEGTLKVGTYAARPTEGDGPAELVVKFEGLVIE